MPYLWKDIESAVKRYKEAQEAVKKVSRELEESESE